MKQRIDIFNQNTLKAFFRRLLLLGGGILLMLTAWAAPLPPVSVTGDVSIIVSGYVLLPPISSVTFNPMNLDNAYQEDASQAQDFSIQSTYLSTGTTPNIALQASIGENHVDTKGAYLSNTSGGNDRVYYRVDYQTCGSSHSTKHLVSTGSTPLPRVVILNAEASPQACQISSGRLIFIRGALQSGSNPEAPPAAGTYTGQITLTASATSETT